MNDLEQIMRSGLRELADEAPAGDAVWTETEQRIAAQRRSRTRKLWTGGGLALAAAIVATVAAAAALHDAPAKHRVEVNKNPKDVPNVVVTPTTSRPTPTTSAARPTPIPGGTVLLEVVDTGIYAVDANGQRTKKLVTPFADQLVDGAQLDPDGESIWYIETKSDHSRICGDVVHLNLATNKREIVTQAVAFAVTKGRLAAARYRDVPSAQTCQPNQVTTSAVSVRDLATGKEINWTPEPAVTSMQATTGAGTSAGSAITSLVWAPDGEQFAVATCNGSCLVKVTAAPGASSMPASLVPLGRINPYNHIDWSGDGLFLATGDSLCCDSPRTGQTVTIERYDAVTLAPMGTLYTAKDRYFINGIASSHGTTYVVAQSYAPGPEPRSGTSSAVHLVDGDRLYKLGAGGALEPVGPASSSSLSLFPVR